MQSVFWIGELYVCTSIHCRWNEGDDHEGDEALGELHLSQFRRAWATPQVLHHIHGKGMWVRFWSLLIRVKLSFFALNTPQEDHHSVSFSHKYSLAKYLLKDPLYEISNDHYIKHWTINSIQTMCFVLAYYVWNILCLTVVHRLTVMWELYDAFHPYTAVAPMLGVEVRKNLKQYRSARIVTKKVLWSTNLDMWLVFGTSIQDLIEMVSV